MSNVEMLPEEDELMDRCMEFASLLTHKALKSERDVLFEFIHQGVMLRMKDDLKKKKYSGYPTLHECVTELNVSQDVLDVECKVVVTIQEMFVNKVLLELKRKGALAMIGGRMA